MKHKNTTVIGNAVRGLTIFVMLLCSGTLLSQTITGPSAVLVGEVASYSYNPGFIVLGNPWTVTNGTPGLQSRTGTTYTISVTWPTAGNGSISFSVEAGEITATKSVTISAPCSVGVPTATNASRCGSGSITLNATPGTSSNSVKWYTAATGGSLVNTGVSYSVTLSSTTTYYISSFDTGTSCESTGARVAVTATINPIPATVLPNHGARCGSGIVTLGASTSATTVRWYNSLTNGTLLAEELGYSPTLSSTTTFYIASYEPSTGCELSPRVAITATINPVPASPTAGGNFRFGAGTFTLTASGAPAGGNYNWYNVATGGSILSSGSSHTTPSISSTTSNYRYVEATDSGPGCKSARTPVTVTVFPIPVINASSNYIAKSGPVNLTSSLVYAAYTWKNGAGATVGTSQTYPATASGNYTLTVTQSGTSYTTPVLGLANQFDGLNENYVVTNIVQDPIGVTIANIGTQTAEKVTQTVQYMNGIGNPSQTVITQGSPTRSDIVEPVVYDKFGRQHRKYLPFISLENTGRLKAGILDVSGNYAGPALNFYSDAKPFAETTFEPSPLNRTDKQGAPGSVWQPNTSVYTSPTDRVIKYRYDLNSASDVLYWTFTYPTPALKLGLVNASTGTTPKYYLPKELLKNRSKDEHHNEIIEFVNQRGQTVLKRIEYAAGKYADTYYVYDDFDNLVCVIPPEAVKGIVASPSLYFGKTDAEKETFLNTWAFRYVYDARRRVIQKKNPGADPLYLVYDILDRVVMTQDGVQRPLKQWLYTKYDNLNRPVVTGIYTHGTVIDQAAMTSQVSTTAFFETYNGATATHGYSNLIFPTTGTVLTVTYYDDYRFILPLIYNNNATLTTYDFKTADITGQETTAFKYVRGQVTGTKINILGSSNYLWTVNYYDPYFRVVQSTSANHKGGLDRVTNKYDFVRLKETKTTHTTSTTAYTTNRRFEYDHAGRLWRTWHKFHTEPEILLVENKYDQLGQLMNKNIHSRNSGTTFAQKTDYTYNVRGWLEKINDINLPETGDLLSMELKYNVPSANGGSPQFNGNISEMIWSAGGMDKQSYGYYYDSLNRLKDARYFNASRPVNNGRYTETIGGVNLKGYDLNGNIWKLSRNGKKDATSYGLMDQLVYTYAGNQATRIDDAIAKNINEEGFQENVKAAGEYTFDKNGSMTFDNNKGVTAITYNHLNLPVQVNKGASEYVVYTYDATGRKLSQQAFGSAPKTTDYIGEFIYESNLLRFALHEEGRVVPDVSAGAPRPWEYQYFLRDHLGNVRVTFSEKKSSIEYKATLETATQTTEQSTFKNYGNRSGFNVHDHTDAGTTFTYSQLLNGGNNSQVGLAKSFAVNPGDVLDLEVFAKYEAPGSTGNNVNTLVTGLISAFGLSTSGVTPLDGAQAYNSFNTMFSPGPYIGRVAGYEDGTAPRAYLNYILFDENFVLKDFGFDQISTAAMQVGVTPVVPHDYLSLHVKVQQKGYLYVYLSNEQSTQTNVYFDDLKIVHHSFVEQISNYYPFGLTFGSYERQGNVPNMFKYNGKEMQDEINLGWLDYGARMYMPDIGRWIAVDPLADQFYPASPYNYTFNNPTNLTDPDGRAGEAIIDEANKTITVNMVYVFYGSGANYMKGAIEILNNMWNANADDEGWSDAGDGWKIRVNAAGIVTDEEGAQEIASDNQGNSLFNYIRVEEQNASEGVTDPVTGVTDHKVSKQSGNSGFWITADMTTTTPAHESGHGLNLSNPWHDNALGIMVPDTEDRKVLPANLVELRNNVLQGQDKSSLVDKYLFRKKRVNVGSTGTTIYDKEGYTKN